MKLGLLDYGFHLCFFGVFTLLLLYNIDYDHLGNESQNQVLEISTSVEKQKFDGIPSNKWVHATSTVKVVLITVKPGSERQPLCASFERVWKSLAPPYGLTRGRGFLENMLKIGTVMSNSTKTYIMKPI